MNRYLSDEKAMFAIACELAIAIDNGLVIFLEGPLGVGKTTFTRGFLRRLGFSGKVKSPTYALVEPYHLTHHTIFHFDLYRLNDAKELAQIGIEDYFSPTSICIIEWPEKGEPYLPAPDLRCIIDFEDDGRRIQVEALSERGKCLISKAI